MVGVRGSGAASLGEGGQRTATGRSVDHAEDVLRAAVVQLVGPWHGGVVVRVADGAVVVLARKSLGALRLLLNVTNLKTDGESALHEVQMMEQLMKDPDQWRGCGCGGESQQADGTRLTRCPGECVGRGFPFDQVEAVAACRAGNIGYGYISSCGWLRLRHISALFLHSELYVNAVAPRTK